MPQVPYRHVTLDPAFLEAIRPDQEADAWLRQLLDAGFIIPLEDLHLREGSPLGGILAVRPALDHLREAELALRQARHPLPWLVGGVPNAVWFGLGGVFLAITAVWNFVMALVIGALLGGVVALLGLVVTLLSMRRRAENIRVKEHELDLARQAMREHVESAFRRSFLARSGRVLVECLPHLRWLNHRINRVQGVLRDPAANEPLRELALSMVETRKRIEARKEAWLRDPEPEWIRDEMEFSVAEVDRKLKDLKVPVGGTDRVLEEVVRGSGSVDPRGGTS